jgi:single-stranded-DNA-specific exonuclease
MNCKLEKNWVVKNKLKGKFSYDKLLKLLLENRDIDDVDGFLNPEISNIPSFEKLFDSVNAAKKIVEAVKAKKKIIIYGDYDVDGISGTCLMWSFLYFELLDFLKIDKQDSNILPYIPDRVDEGYGLSTQSLDKLSKEGVELIITVDCGVRDKELINNYDIEFVVTDHHIPPEDILENLNYNLVHQLYPGNEYPFPSVCGAFVIFLLILAIKNEVGMDSSFEKNKKYLDLVSLATVTDIMPLHGVNRIVVKHGLESLSKCNNLGLCALAQKAQIDLKDIATYHLGYILGPRLNASGRIDSAMQGLKLLSTKDRGQAEELAKTLDNLNFERQRITKEILEDAREKILKEDLQKLIFVSGKDWNEGVIGLVASRIQDEFHRPVLVVTESNGEIKGSARSINGLNITEVIEKFSKYLVKFGGHSQAAGFSVKEGMLDDFGKEITEFVNENLEDEILKKTLDIDAVLETKHLNIEFVANISKLEPFGYGNRRPLFLFEKVVVVSKRILGKDQNHMKLELKGSGEGVDEAIMFNCLDDIEKINEDDVIDVVAHVGINEWNNLTKVQIEVKDWRTCKVD